MDCDEVAALALSSARTKAQQKIVDSRTAESGSLAEEAVTIYESWLGVGAVLVMVTISGYAAIYFESMLKKGGDRTLTIWERNFQLAFYSTILLVFIVVYEENNSGTLSQYVFFEGWTITTVIIALIQAGGGLLVAATLKYADAVLKTLATSGSIVLSAVLGFMLLGGMLDIFVSMGCLATILAIFNYTLDSTPEVLAEPAAVARLNV